MSGVSLYDATLRGFAQALTGCVGFLEKSAKHFQETGVDLDGLLEVRLIEDMFPLRFQLTSVLHHSKGAVEGVRSGRFAPPSGVGEHGYLAFTDQIRSAAAELAAISPEEAEGWIGRDMVFAMRGMEMPFRAEDFLLSFSLPNLHFHAATSYDILRMKGAPIGKRDYMGPLRMKSA